jgi:hypothetical protein
MAYRGPFSWKHQGFKIAILGPLLALAGLATAFGAKPSSCTDTSVTTIISDVDPGGNANTFSSDGAGPYYNGVDYVTSILTCNGYNGIKNGDWQFNKLVTVKRHGVVERLNARNVGVSLDTEDAVQPGDPHYTAPADAPFWGTQILYGYSEVKCTAIGNSMLTMAANTAMTCPGVFSFYTATDDHYYLLPAHSFLPSDLPETTDIQVTCNSADSGGCNDWFIEPIGSLQAVGRLVPASSPASPDLTVNDGDFYMRFQIHVTRP